MLVTGTSLLPSGSSPPPRSTLRNTVWLLIDFSNVRRLMIADADLAGKPFFAGLIKYMLSGPICAMVWEGKEVVKTGRGMYSFFQRHGTGSDCN